MILNFIIDFLLIISVSIILKRNITIIKAMYGAFIGGLSIILLFFNINSFELFIIKFLISICMILISFGYKNLKYTLVNIFYLYISSIVLGGFLYLINNQFSYKNDGIIFYYKGVSVNFIFLLITSPIIMYIYIKQLKNYKSNYSNYYNIEIYLKGKSYKYTAYLDSGNTLVDNVTGKFVILIDKRKLLFNIKEFRLIPYSTISGTSMLKVIKINKLLFQNNEYKNVLLGVVDNINLDGIDVILNRKLLEG